MIFATSVAMRLAGIRLTVLFFFGFGLLVGSSAWAALPEALTAEFGTPPSLGEAPDTADAIGSGEPAATENELKLPVNVLADLRRDFLHEESALTRRFTFTLAPRWYYRNALNDDGSRSVAAAYGGSFGLETPWFWDFLRLGFIGFTSQRLYGPADEDGSGLLAAGQRGYTVLGAAFLDLRIRQTTLRVGRQRIDLPYINGNDSRMTPNTFEALALRSKDWDKLRVGLAHISGIKPRTSTSFESMSSAAGAPGTDDGVTVVGARYEFAKETYLSFVNQTGWNTFNTFYAEGAYFHPITDDTSVEVGGQFTDQRSLGRQLGGDFEVQSAGAITSFGFRSLIASVSGTWTSNTSGIQKPWGGSPSYNSVLIADFDRAGETSLRVGCSYDFTDVGLQGVAASTSWTYGVTPNSGETASPDQGEYDVNFDYRPEFAHLDGVWLRVRYGVLYAAGSGPGPTSEDFRVILNYSVEF